ncbi:Mitochondrial ornithine transporter 1 [Seminavis robusta]|uniref:Mitochondrial ornithine transporter 1 n=1 Tax=Seminavis robusta TaxID=568900 RepID=A0A9N8HYS6_9STRA|nr:Mitochondrial ornithine transporter 1 [Seminavis robusta]|eukprot:Sro2066_g313290.1 Mitochondrial ornithine transporter 1 (304) ;mRNA; f:12454-13736
MSESTTSASAGDATASVADPRAISRDVFSATLGSICCCYTGQPLDTIKVRMQTNPAEFPGVFSTTTSIFKNEGMAAFWKGSIPTAVGMAFENAMAFGVNEALKRAFPDDPAQKNLDAPPDLGKPFLMGAITGCCSALVLLPSEVIKTKTQFVVGENVSSQEIMRRMIKHSGYKSLFAGLDAQLARDASFYALFFGGYELFCYSFRTFVPSMPEELNYFISGGFAGMFGWAMAMPFDVPKTNVQARYDCKIVGSYFPELFKIARERGVVGLYAGLGPTLARAFPANAALFLGVEMGKKLFDKVL